MPRPWTVETSRLLHDDRWLRVRADRCVTPSGAVLDPYYVLEYPDWINVVAVTEAEEVVLVRQYRHGAAATLLELPSGIVDPGETDPMATALRELEEETGFTAGPIERTGVVSANPATLTNRTHCYLATGCRRLGAARPDPTEEIEVVLLPLAELGARALAGEFLQALHVSSIFFALARLGRLRLS